MKRTLFIVVLMFVGAAACADSTKEEWRESGRSWRGGGRQFLRALGFSVAGEGSPKEEWKQTGEEFREAGKDTADALGESIKPAQQ